MKLQTREVNEFPPVWKQFGYFSSLMFRRETLLYVAVASIFVLLMLHKSINLWLAPPFLLTFMWFFCGYLFNTLLRIAHGYLDASGGPVTGYGGMGLTAKAIMVLALDGALLGWMALRVRATLVPIVVQSQGRSDAVSGWVVRHLSLLVNPLNLVVLAFFVFLLVKPAQMILLATSRSIWQTVKPARVYHTIVDIGPRYVLILLVDYLFSGSGFEVLKDTSGLLPQWLAVVIFCFVFLGNWLTTVAMMGYVCLERHVALDLVISPVVARKAAAGGRHDPVAEVLAEVAGLVGSGDHKGALRFLRAAIERTWGQERLHAEYFKLAVLNGEINEALGMARTFVTSLVHANKVALALQWYQRGAALSPAFLPANLGDLLLLAKEAEGNGDSDLALALVGRLATENGRHPQLPDALLLKMRVLLSRRDTEMATGVLTEMRKHFPDHPASAMADSYLHPGKPINAASAAG